MYVAMFFVFGRQHATIGHSNVDVLKERVANHVVSQSYLRVGAIHWFKLVPDRPQSAPLIYDNF